VSRQFLLVLCLLICTPWLQSQKANQKVAGRAKKAVAPTVAAKKQGPSSGDAAKPDSYFLVFDWMPAVCDPFNTTGRCSYPWRKGFAIEGLDPIDKTGKEQHHCSRKASITDPSTLATLFPDPDSVFKTWDDRGTCSGLDPNTYFSEIERLTSQYGNIPFELQIEPDFEETDAQLRDQMAAANVGSTGASAEAPDYQVRCLENHLKAIALCLDSDRKPIACKATNIGCLKSIEIVSDQNSDGFYSVSETSPTLRYYSLTSSGLIFTEKRLEDYVNDLTKSQATASATASTQTSGETGERILREGQSIQNASGQLIDIARRSVSASLEIQTHFPVSGASAQSTSGANPSNPSQATSGVNPSNPSQPGSGGKAPGSSQPASSGNHSNPSRPTSGGNPSGSSQSTSTPTSEASPPTAANGSSSQPTTPQRQGNTAPQSGSPDSQPSISNETKGSVGTSAADLGGAIRLASSLLTPDTSLSKQVTVSYVSEPLEKVVVDPSNNPPPQTGMSAIVMQETRSPMGLPKKGIVAVVGGADVAFPAIQFNYDLLIQEQRQVVADGEPITGNTLKAAAQSGDHHIELYRESDPWDCRIFPDAEETPLSFDIHTAEESNSVIAKSSLVRNGIVLNTSKIIDTYWLQTKLTAIQTQLSNLALWSSGAITNQFGNLQGQQGTNSYTAVQVSAAPTPQLSTSTTNGYGATQSSLQSGTVQAQCSAGTVPTLGSGNTISCVVPSTSSTAPTTPTTMTTATNQATAPSYQTTNQVTQPSFTPTAPTMPTVATPSAPTNVGISSGDILAEQIQLNSQLTIYQALLNGAQSDNFFVQENGRISGVRRQTTLAFPVSIEPYRAYKDAVAEVRIIVVPRASSGTNELSLVNLLPAAKTYNVAKVATSTKQFGAGVAVQALGVSGVTGKTKTQLYLVKDTDTVALEYPQPLTAEDRDGHKRLGDEFRYSVPLGGCVDEGQTVLSKGLRSKDTTKSDGDTVKSLSWDTISKQLDASSYDSQKALVFGWQFRPVLGADYVQAGQRTVFAQIALNSTTPSEAPLVFVETRWRAFDRGKQVAGPVFERSCTWRLLRDAAAADNPIKVKDVRVEDLGDGTLRIAALGDFTDPALTIRYGAKHIVPDVVPSDGRRLEFYQPAKDLIQAPEIDLVSEASQPTRLETPLRKGISCSLKSAKIAALPLPDSTSIVTLHAEYGKDWMPSNEGSRQGFPQPLVLIGNDVYGLRGNPYQSMQCGRNPDDNSLDCDYQFRAQTSSLRTSGVFTAANLGWPNSRVRGAIAFAPAFTVVKAMATVPDDSLAKSKTCAKGDKKCLQSVPKKDTSKEAGPFWYELTGSDFFKIPVAIEPAKGVAAPVECSSFPCLRLIAAGKVSTPIIPDHGNFYIASDTQAFVRLPAGSDRAPLRIIWEESAGQRDKVSEWDVAFDKADAKKSAIIGDPAQLHKGDSRTVSFSGTAFCPTTTVTFEKTNLSSTLKDSKTLQVLVTSDVTKTTGHKELQAVTACGTVTLPFDVVSP